MLIPSLAKRAAITAPCLGSGPSLGHLQAGFRLRSFPRIFCSTDHSIFTPIRRRAVPQPCIMKAGASSLSTAVKDSGVGLAGEQLLTDPMDWGKLVSDCREGVARCRKIATTSRNPKEVLRASDDISYHICRAADLASAMASIHPEVSVRAKAGSAWFDAIELMKVLNTDKELMDAVKFAIGESEHLDHEESQVLEDFVAEFKNSGADFPAPEREKATSCAIQVEEALSKYRSSWDSAISKGVMMEKDEINKMNDFWKRHIASHGSIQSRYVSGFLTECSDKQLRQNVFLKRLKMLSQHTEPQLIQLLDSRAQSALTLGKKNFSEVVLWNTALRDCDMVMEFLIEICTHLEPSIRVEMSELQKFAGRSIGAMDLKEALAPWNFSFLSQQLQSRLSQSMPHSHEIAPFFPVDKSVELLTVEVLQIFGLQAKRREPGHGETWHPTVLVFDVKDNMLSTDIISTLYVDVSPQTLDYKPAGTRAILSGRPGESNSGHKNDQAILWQGSQASGAVAVVSACLGGASGYLTLPDIMTLSHELGHASHHFLGITKFQHTSGLRGTLESIETPSTFAELYSKLPEFLVRTSVPNGQRRLSQSMARRAIESIRSPMPALQQLGMIMDTAMDALAHSWDGQNGPMTAEWLQSRADAVPKLLLPNLHQATPNRPGDPWSLVQGHPWYLTHTHYADYSSSYWSYLWAQGVSTYLLSRGEPGLATLRSLAKFGGLARADAWMQAIDLEIPDIARLCARGTTSMKSVSPIENEQ